jgi:hypothetical protein
MKYLLAIALTLISLLAQADTDSDSDGVSDTTWIQVGDDIFGKAAFDFSGSGVSLSGDGSLVAITASGYVDIYAWDGVAWFQRGESINGKLGGILSAASLSPNGNVVAVAVPGNDEKAVDAGLLQLFAWNGSGWEQRGEDFFGMKRLDQIGNSVSLSSDGSLVAIGGRYKIQMYGWNGSAWVQRGADIDGMGIESTTNGEVSLSGDGAVVAIGGRNHDGNRFLDVPFVRLFAWDGSSWTQMGADLEGSFSNGGFDGTGTSVSLSEDGSVVAIGSPYVNLPFKTRAGHVRVFAWDGAVWEQRGNNIDGEAEADESGRGVSLSGDGTVVVIGAGPERPARLYSWDGSDWMQEGSDIGADGNGNLPLGHGEVSLSSDGTVMAVGLTSAEQARGRVSLFGEEKVDNCVSVPNADQIDLDKDEVGDACDNDDDGDGVLDTLDAYPRISLGQLSDTDGDGRPNDCSELCSELGMDADVDDDGDGVLDDSDGFPLISLDDRLDTDKDGYPDVCQQDCLELGMTSDLDDDNDGVPDVSDAFPLDAAESVDTDNDGFGNNADDDDDGDGTQDDLDAFPLDPQEDTDSNNNGVGDNEDGAALEKLLSSAREVGRNQVISTPALYGLLTEEELDTATSDLTKAITANPTAYGIDVGFDLDGDGESKPLTDGLLLIRYLFGFSGDSLISGAIGAGATRDTAEAVEAYIKERVPAE